MFGLLVGAAFSLWRAAFLVDAERDWPKILEKAETFLEAVVEDNTINYLQDKNTRNWTVGYYLNNARYRLGRVLSKFANNADYGPIADIAAFQGFKDIKQSGGIDARPATDVWNGTYDALYAAFELKF